MKPEVYPIVRKGGKFDVVVENIRRFLEMSKGKKIVVEIQRMITTQTHDESVKSFREFFHLDRYPQATVIQKTCEGLDTSEVTELHQAYYGCFQGTPYQWFVILCNGDVTHCCYDYDGTQKLGNVREKSIPEIAALPVPGDDRGGLPCRRLLAAPPLRRVLQEPGRQASPDRPPLALRAALPVEGPVPAVPECPRRGKLTRVALSPRASS